MKTIGSQTTATLEEEDLVLFSMGKDEIIVLTKDNKLERWGRNDDFAGFVLELFNARYEFIESIGSITQKQREEAFSG